MVDHPPSGFVRSGTSSPLFSPTLLANNVTGTDYTLSISGGSILASGIILNIDEKQTDILEFMNWLAICFARSEDGHSTKESLIKLIWTMWITFSPSLATFSIHAIVDAVWMRFLRKARLLRFTAVLNKREGSESPKRINSLAVVLSNGDSNAMLRVAFDFISDLEHATLASESHDLKFRYFSRMTSLCSALINSDFFDDAINRCLDPAPLPPSVARVSVPP
ncbi:uncharacterized protein BT62DRAFT_1079313 [Guyanagaster necrorhizus]|uniref:Uncharacterized protein n=1 Tax=Guyanagaster necrorhizus TaxID=856835 RepID=A0A9P7VJU6_9AGAR|nr:uncharacterized protein BT62DRAFT_1079313 [Guyanagaster necrorhizus MCA 3950]KAG7442456.1 hypothetical protein BT62DRAFT_1079313 [Guyanagaster necrorhizus MCA 3950]